MIPMIPAVFIVMIALFIVGFLALASMDSNHVISSYGSDSFDSLERLRRQLRLPPISAGSYLEGWVREELGKIDAIEKQEEPMSQMLPKDLLKDAEKGNRTAEMLGEGLSSASQFANPSRSAIEEAIRMANQFARPGAVIDGGRLGDTVYIPRLG